MLTCFATIANIVSRNEGIIKSDLIELTKNTPMDRLMDLKTHHSVDGTLLQKIREDYAWFLEITNIPEADLISYFQKRENKVDAFLRADKFGEKMFRLITELSRDSGYLRYLVI